MSDQNQNDTISFDLPKNQSSVIKVIGVGGGGSNAVNHMFGMGIRGVDFAICNTDSQALSNSPVPNKIQLGVTLTEGLGAGANPEVGEQAAQESMQDIKNLLETHTKMVFITAGMGGGTGTGAAPVIAKAAKDLGILTVGIVTMPFLFEGNNRKLQAEKGIEALRNNVDSLIVINNNKLREVFGNLGFKAGFAKADEVLATAARGIAEVITHHYTTNIDLRDAKTVLADSGTAIMGSATASGEKRASGAISKALDSPLLNDNHIKGAKNVLLLIVSGKDEITIDEIGEINDHIQMEAGGSANIIMGIGEDESLGNDIAVTIVATGFNAEQQVQVIGREPQKVVHTLEDEQAVSTSVYSKPLKHDDEDNVEDDMIARELARAENKKQQHKEQTLLFSMEEEREEEFFETPLVAEKEAIYNVAEEAETEEKEDEKTVYSLSEDDDELKIVAEVQEEEDSIVEEEEMSIRLEEEEEEESKDINMEDEEDNEPLFSIGDDNEEKKEVNFSFEHPKKPETKEEPAKEEKVNPPAKPEPIRYSLEDYIKLEERLKSAAPEKSENKTAAKTETEIEDKDLQFEIKRMPEKEGNKSSRNNGSPLDSTIADSNRNRAEERRASLKAFNHRFKNHLYGKDETINEPAYKRQGINIDNDKYSSESRVSRFSINDDENGGNIKTNNSFLHDNVD